MKLAKMLVAMSCPSLLLVVLLGVTSHAYAQDAGEIDENVGTWSAPGADGAEQSIPEVKTHPLKIKGCWSGTVMDTADGMGTVTFQFSQSSNRKKILVGSIIQFTWPDTAKATVPMKGSVTSSGFTFKGNAGQNCPVVSGSATGDATALTGIVEFTGGCSMFFQKVTFSIARGCP